MHHDFFAWVRLLLFIILMLAFALWCNIANTRYQMEQPEPEKPFQKEPIYVHQASPQNPHNFPGR